MGAIDWSSLSRLVPEIALVVIFIWFTLERDKRQDASSEKRDAAWREFLKEQREQNNLAIARIAEEVKDNTKALAMMNKAIIEAANDQ